MKQESTGNGLGRAFPPSRRNVRVYFAQKGKGSTLADLFFDHYESRSWRGRSDKPLKDWKMRAWQWIWGSRPGGSEK